MKKINCFISCLALLFLISSCGTRIHYAEFIKPSDVYIPSTVRSVLVINRGAAENDVSSVYAGGQRVDDIVGLPKLAADSIIDRFKKEIQKTGRFHFVEMDEDYSPKRTSKFMEDTLSNEEIQQLCASYNVDAIISLDGISLDIQAENDVEIVSAYDQYGGAYRTPQFVGQRRIDISVGWRMYDCKRLIIGDEYNADYSVLFTNRVATEEEVNATLPGGIVNVIEVAAVAAEDYSMRVAPHWESDYRKYYYTGSEKLTAADNLIYYENNWEEASLIWSKLAQDVNAESKLRYKAMYNMALASEMLGKPELAKEWLLQAIEVNSTGQAKKYLRIIEEQILIYNIVDNQLMLENNTEEIE